MKDHVGNEVAFVHIALAADVAAIGAFCGVVLEVVVLAIPVSIEGGMANATLKGFLSTVTDEVFGKVTTGGELLIANLTMVRIPAALPCA